MSPLRRKERTAFDPLVLRDSRSVSKHLARDSGVEVQYPAERCVESVDPGPAIEPFPETSTYSGCGSSDQETAARMTADFTGFNVHGSLVHGYLLLINRLDWHNLIADEHRPKLVPSGPNDLCNCTRKNAA